MKLIYCSAGNNKYAEIAIRHGFSYGARLPHKVYFAPVFVDQEWKNPVRTEHKQSRLYQLLAAAQVEQNISTMVETGTVPERQLRELAEQAKVRRLSTLKKGDKSPVVQNFAQRGTFCQTSGLWLETNKLPSSGAKGLTMLSNPVNTQAEANMSNGGKGVRILTPLGRVTDKVAEIAARAEANQGTRTDIRPNLDRSVNTLQEIANAAEASTLPPSTKSKPSKNPRPKRPNKLLSAALTMALVTLAASRLRQ